VIRLLVERKDVVLLQEHSLVMVDHHQQVLLQHGWRGDTRRGTLRGVQLPHAQGAAGSAGGSAGGRAGIEVGQVSSKQTRGVYAVALVAHVREWGFLLVSRPGFAGLSGGVDARMRA